jgi:hypothetical protein
VGSVRRRLERLEAERQRGDARLTREALRHLSDGDLATLEEALEAGQENGSATFENLYRVVTERGKRSLGRLLECLAAIGEGREPPSYPEAGVEETKRSRNAYRIWKYYKK